MPSRPVHWFEGMFLHPHHFQAAERHGREVGRMSEDWYHPFNWGLRSIDLDRDAIANYTLALRSCEARFKDGTKLTIPGDSVADSVDLREALSRSEGSVTVFLAIPAMQAGRANVEEHPTADGPRYSIETSEVEDENDGGHEQPLQFHRTRCRLLLSTEDPTGYEILPLARIERSTQLESAPQLDLGYVPPLLAASAWMPLWRSIQSLLHQIGARIEQMSSQLVGRGISFESQVPGDAERILKLWVLNGAFSLLESTAYVRGLPPFAIYQELCRLVGQLAIFSDDRRPPNLPQYNHEDLAGCFQTVIKYIQLGLDTVGPSAFEKRYFERAGDRLQVALDPAWLVSTRSLYLGVETDLNDQDCQAMLDSMDMKVGSGAQVEAYFRQRMKGLKLTPIARPPRALPAGAGTVYFQVERDPVFWRDVADSHTMAIRLNLAHASFQGDRILTVAAPGRQQTTNLLFALFII